MKRIALSFFLFALAAAAQAQVSVTSPWVRATVAQQKSTGAFMQLKSAQDARLVAVQSPVAGVVEVHDMVMEGNVMRMRPLEQGLALPAGQAVELKPGGYHVMLMDLKQQVKDGDTVPLTLVIEARDGQRQNLEVQAPVRPLGAAAGQGAHSHGMKH